MTATTDAKTAIGDVRHVEDGKVIFFKLTMLNLQGAHPEIVHDQPDRLLTDEEMTRFDVRSDGKRHWFRVNIRSMDGRLLILSNPIYINF